MKLRADVYIAWLRAQLPWAAEDHSAMALILFFSVALPTVSWVCLAAELVDRFLY